IAALTEVALRLGARTFSWNSRATATRNRGGKETRSRAMTEQRRREDGSTVDILRASFAPGTLCQVAESPRCRAKRPQNQLDDSAPILRRVWWMGSSYRVSPSSFIPYSVYERSSRSRPLP